MYNGIRDRHSEQDQKKLIAQEYYDRIKKCNRIRDRNNGQRPLYVQCSMVHGQEIFYRIKYNTGTGTSRYGDQVQ